MTRIEFTACGNPKGQPRARAFARNGHARMYDPATAEGWKSCIAQAARDFLPAAPLTGPLSLEALFVMPRPRGHYGSGKRSAVLKPTAPMWCVTKPDRDNLDKALMDALTTLGMWVDDCQVCAGEIRKRYQVGPEERPGVRVRIETLDEIPTAGAGVKA